MGRDGTLAAQPQPIAAVDQSLVTKVYDFKPLLGDHGRANNVPDGDAVIKLIESLPLDGLKPGTDVPQLKE